MSYFSSLEAEALVREGNEAYARGDCGSAQETYEKLIAHGRSSSDILYNAGTVALANGDVGHAVFYLERARRLSARRDDVEANLAIARSRQVDQVVGASEEASVWRRLSDAAPAHWVVPSFASLWVVGFLFLIIHQAIRRKIPSLWRVGSFLLLLSVPGGLLTFAHAYVNRHEREGVVMEKVLPARELPSTQARASFEMHPGLKIKLLEFRGDYVRVRLPNGLSGWAERQGIAEL